MQCINHHFYLFNECTINFNLTENWRSDTSHATFTSVGMLWIRILRYRADPLLGPSHRMELGDVREYLSPEMGLIQLRHTGRTVLFHLNQVWSSCSNTDNRSEASDFECEQESEEQDHYYDDKEDSNSLESSKEYPLKNKKIGQLIREKLEETSELAELLPISTEVRVITRQLPISLKSPVRGQNVSPCISVYTLVSQGDIMHQIQGYRRGYKGLEGDAREYKEIQGDKRSPHLELVIADERSGRDGDQE